MPRPLSLRIHASLPRRAADPGLRRALIGPSERLLEPSPARDWHYVPDLNFHHHRDMAALAKVVLGFHNSGGGAIFAGIQAHGDVLGIHVSAAPHTAATVEALSAYVPREVGLFVEHLPAVRANHVVVVLFVPRRTGPVVACVAAGPPGAGTPVVTRGAVYYRSGSETRRVASAMDEVQMLRGEPLRRTAYDLEVDEPFYRLLAPHCESFIGRDALIAEVEHELAGHQRIHELDGHGGVGKSALALRIARRAYDTGRYEFIASMSAKATVWAGFRASSVQPAFSTHGEFLVQLAQVLGIEAEQPMDTLERDVLQMLEAADSGLIVLDNMERVQDRDLYQFLNREIPPHIRVLMTSRMPPAVGASRTALPPMTPGESAELLELELERALNDEYRRDPTSVASILEATHGIPLAIKWAAALAWGGRSLAEVARELAEPTAARREFLKFCLHTMYEGLSPLARQAAVLLPHLGDQWGIGLLACALDRSEAAVEEAIQELEDHAVIYRGPTGVITALPFTLDFLQHQVRSVDGERVTREALSRLVVGDAQILELTPAERTVLLRDRAFGLLERGEVDEAWRTVRLAAQGEPEPRLQFLEGRILVARAQARGEPVHRGIDAMQAALASARGSDHAWKRGWRWILASAHLARGTLADLGEAASLMGQAIAEGENTQVAELDAFVSTAADAGRDGLLILALKTVRERALGVRLAHRLQRHPVYSRLLRARLDDVSRALEHLEVPLRVPCVWRLAQPRADESHLFHVERVGQPEQIVIGAHPIARKAHGRQLRLDVVLAAIGDQVAGRRPTTAARVSQLLWESLPAVVQQFLHTDALPEDVVVVATDAPAVPWESLRVRALGDEVLGCARTVARAPSAWAGEWRGTGVANRRALLVFDRHDPSSKDEADEVGAVLAGAGWTPLPVPVDALLGVTHDERVWGEGFQVVHVCGAEDSFAELLTVGSAMFADHRRPPRLCFLNWCGSMTAPFAQRAAGAGWPALVTTNGSVAPSTARCLAVEVYKQAPHAPMADCLRVARRAARAATSDPWESWQWYAFVGSPSLWLEA